MRRPILAMVLCSLLVPAAAAAHGSLEPTAASLGASQRFVLTIPNSLVGGPRIVGVELTIPAGVTLESAEGSQPRWQVEISGTTVTWRGGPLEGLSEDFAFRATMPEVEGPVEFQSRELYADGATPPFALPVVVTQFAGPSSNADPPAAAPAASSSGDGLAWAAIALAATALLLALVALAVALRSRAREPEPATDPPS